MAQARPQAAPDAASTTVYEALLDGAPDDPAPPAPPRRGRRADTTGSNAKDGKGPLAGVAALVPAELSRRTLLLAAGGGAAAVGGTAVALGKGTGGSTAAASGSGGGAAAAPVTANLSQTPSATATKAPPKPAGAVLALPKSLEPDLLIRRVTYGRTPELAADVEKLGMKAWLTQQLEPAKIKDAAGDAIVGRFPSLGWSIDKARSSMQVGDWKVMIDLVSAHLGRALWSERQLLEVMVDFWSNHLNVTCPSSDVWAHRHRYDADVIRKHALGTFEGMLQASSVHPSMLVYLNNAGSSGQEPNENYARELLELHTVGVDGGYTEKDVKRAALLLTGWEVKDDKAVYTPDRHFVGKVKVMDFSHANGSAAGGKKAQAAYVKHLARHPRTAQEIARKLAVRFVADEPPAALVKSLAAVYTREKTAIVPVLRALFSSKEFAESGGQKVRRPFERLAATVRALGVGPGKDPQGLTDLYWQLQGSGQQPLGWSLPDGYSDVATAWQSPASALEQFNATAGMVHGWFPQKLDLPGPKELLAKAPTSRSAAIEAVGRRVLGRTPSEREAAAASSLLKGTKLPKSFSRGTWEQEETVALVATLFLNSPAHLIR